MRKPLIALALAALVVSGAAGAAVFAAKDPKSLALRLSDFPAGTRYVPQFGMKGQLGNEWNEAFEIRPNDQEREEDVGLEIWVGKDVASAKQIYENTVDSYTGKGVKLAELAKAFKGEVQLLLTGFGDEQTADYLPNPMRPHGQLIVRKGTVVWYLSVENCTPLAVTCYGTSRSEKPIGKSVALAELRKYGAKQKARVGR